MQSLRGGGSPGAIGPKAAPAIPALSAAFEREEEESTVQTRCVDALGEIGDPAAAPFLIAALEHAEDSVRWHAIEALESLGPRAEAAVPALLRVVQHDAANGWLAANALGRIDVEGLSVPVLIDKLAGRDAQMRRFAALGLSRMGRKASAAADMLYQGLRDPDQAARIAAAQAYWSVSGQADDAVRVLRSELAGSSDWKAQMWAADALAEIGPAAQAAVPELMARLSSDTRYVVTSSAEALGKIGPAAVPARPALTARLRDAGDFYTRVVHRPGAVADQSFGGGSSRLARRPGQLAGFHGRLGSGRSRRRHGPRGRRLRDAVAPPAERRRSVRQKGRRGRVETTRGQVTVASIRYRRPQSAAILYRCWWPRRNSSRPTMAGEASMPSDSLLTANTTGGLILEHQRDAFPPGNTHGRDAHGEGKCLVRATRVVQHFLCQVRPSSRQCCQRRCCRTPATKHVRAWSCDARRPAQASRSHPLGSRLSAPFPPGRFCNHQLAAQDRRGNHVRGQAATLPDHLPGGQIVTGDPPRGGHNQLGLAAVFDDAGCGPAGDFVAFHVRTWFHPWLDRGPSGRIGPRGPSSNPGVAVHDWRRALAPAERITMSPRSRSQIGWPSRS